MPHLYTIRCCYSHYMVLSLTFSLYNEHLMSLLQGQAGFKEAEAEARSSEAG